VSPPASGAPGLVASVIDVGSNSVLLLTVAVGTDGAARTLDAALATTRLAAGLRGGRPLDPAARTRTVEAVVAFVRRARATGAERLWAFATGAVRDAADGPAFARALEAASGVPLEVLAGAREAELAYAAVAAGYGGRPLLVADIGGRTTELTLGAGDDLLGAVSLPLGALTLTDEQLHADPSAPAELARVRAAADAALATTDLTARARALGATFAASGGTATALAALDLGLAVYEGRRVHGHAISHARLAALTAWLTALPAPARAALPALDPGRAAILPAGALVLERVARAAGATAVRVSDRGVRHAYLRERLAAEGIAAELGEPTDSSP